MELSYQSDAYTKTLPVPTYKFAVRGTSVYPEVLCNCSCTTSTKPIV
jgi:hypothetical protein